MADFTDRSPFHEDTESAHGWLVVGLAEQAFAISSHLVRYVFPMTEAGECGFEDSGVPIRIYGGRPWFVLPMDRLFATFGPLSGQNPAAWTVALNAPEGVAIEVATVEGPYRGVVMGDRLTCNQGNWPVLTPLLPGID